MFAKGHARVSRSMFHFAAKPPVSSHDDLTGYDNMMKKYVSSWIDNMGTGIVMSEGSVDAAHKLFTFHSMVNDPMTGKPGKVKMVSKVVDDNRHVFSYYGDQGGKEMLQMEITYLRK